MAEIYKDGEYPSQDETITVKELVLIPTRFRSAFNGHALQHLSLEQRKNALQGKLYEFETEIMGQKLATKTISWSVSAPHDWWQAFKHQYFPEWLKEKFPVKMETFGFSETVSVREIYPDLPEVFPKGATIRKKILSTDAIREWKV